MVFNPVYVRLALALLSLLAMAAVGMAPDDWGGGP